MQNTVVSGQDKRISSRILLSDVVTRRSFGPGSVPVPVVGRHSSTQSRASPGRRPGLQSPVPALGRRTGGQSRSPAALCVHYKTDSLSDSLSDSPVYQILYHPTDRAIRGNSLSDSLSDSLIALSVRVIASISSGDSLSDSLIVGGVQRTIYFYYICGRSP